MFPYANRGIFIFTKQFSAYNCYKRRSICVIKEGVYALSEINAIKSFAIRKNFLNNLSYFKKVTTFVIGKQGCFK